MGSAVLDAVIRRGVLDLLHECGGEHNHGELAAIMNELGHSVARKDVLAALDWLAGQALVVTEKLDLFTVAQITGDGSDVATGKIVIDGVSRFKTGV